MQRDVQIELIKRIFRHLDRETTDLAPHMTRIPVGRYTDPDQLERERRILFREYPLLVGLSGQLASPGSYWTTCLGGTPLLLVRDETGEIGAYVNVCRHRGAILAQGAGRATRGFSCPYHGWSYDLAGRLVHLPGRAHFPGVREADLGLLPLPVVEKDGLLWVSPDPRGRIDPDGHLEELADELAALGFAGYHHYAGRVLRQQMNWKMVIDTFLEPYHFSVLHRNTVGPILFSDLCLFTPFGPHLREVLPRRSIETLRGRPVSEWDLITHSAIAYVLFPNTVLVIQGDHVEIWRVFPAGERVDECVVYLDLYTPQPAVSESARGHWDRNLELAIKTVVEEDFSVGEGIQRGLASGANNELTFGRNEPALAHYQNTVAARSQATDS